MAYRLFDKYIEKYAESDIIQLGIKAINLMPNTLIFEHVVVIPAYNESTDFINRFLSSALAQQPVLVIVVINQPQSCNNSTPQQHLYNTIINTGISVFNDELPQLKAAHHAELNAEINIAQHRGCALIKPDHNNCYIWAIDCFSNPLPEDQGVGLARKIGSDLALYLKSKNRIQSDWIHSTDADAHLPNDYFSSVKNLSNQPQHKNTVALSYNFTHVNKNVEIHTANHLYETALRYYVSGLTYAKSPYAFFTIGSVIAFKAEEYVKVRGFPKRSAGEDFYLLNKLAKLGHIGFVKDTLVTIDARVSDRVPFGTGPAVASILQLTENGQPYCYYHPQVFEELKICIFYFEQLWDNRLTLDKWFKNLSSESQVALHDIKLAHFVEKQKNSNQVQFNKQLTVWFDAFKTLKFIHSLREQKYSDIPLSQALERASFNVQT